jgi:hypothetical protein
MINVVEQMLLKIQAERPEAFEFLVLFGQHCAAIDDIVDEEKDSALVKQSVLYSTRMYNCNYWRKWGHTLVLLERVIVNSYFDSVKWEKAEEEWKRQVAKVHSHDGMLMTFAVILIEYGDEALAEVSLAWREQAYELHKHDKI